MGQLFKFEQPLANADTEPENGVRLTLEQADIWLKHMEEYRNVLALDLRNSRRHLEELGGRKFLKELEKQLQGINEWQEDVDKKDIRLVNSLK